MYNKGFISHIVLVTVAAILLVYGTYKSIRNPVNPLIVGTAPSVLNITQGGTKSSSFSPLSVLTSGTTSTSALLASSSPSFGYLIATSTTASSTIAYGLEIASGNLRVGGLVSCNTIDTNANGYFTCGVDTGGGGTFEWTPATWGGLSVNSTTTIIQFLAGSVSATSSIGTLTVGNVTATTTTATSTFQGLSGNLLNITSTSATSTFANGIQLTGGCFGLIGGSCAGTGGGTTPTATTTVSVLPVSCAPRTTSAGNAIAVGNSYISPISMTNNYWSVAPMVFSSATTSDIGCLFHIPENMNDTPHPRLYITSDATSTSLVVAVLEVEATSTNPLGGIYDPILFTTILASTTAGDRITVPNVAYVASTTIKAFSSPTLTGGYDLLMRLIRYGANAADTLTGELYVKNIYLLLDVDIN